MSRTETPRAARQRRHIRVRQTVAGTPDKPRLAVFRSSNHIYAQIIDDSAGHTLVHASDAGKDMGAVAKGKKKSDVAALVGEMMAKKAREKGIEAVVFDRAGFRYHGRVKALAEAARKGGLRF